MAEWPHRHSFGDIGNRSEYSTTDVSRMRALHTRAVQRVEQLLLSDRSEDAGKTDYSSDDVVDLLYWQLKHTGRVGAERYILELNEGARSTIIQATDVATRAILYVMRDRQSMVREKAVVSVRQTFEDTIGVFVNDYTLESYAGGTFAGTIAHTRPETVRPIDRHMTPYDFHQLDKQLRELAIMAGASMTLDGDQRERAA